MAAVLSILAAVSALNRGIAFALRPLQ